MARRRRYTKDPVAARKRRILVQSIGVGLLVGLAAFMVFMAVTSS